MLAVLLGSIGLVAAGFTSVYVRDLKKNIGNNRKGVFVPGLFVGFITDFLDAIGIGSFATTTAIFKLNAKLRVADKLLPGTLNVAHTLPMITQALMSLTVIEVDILTLISMIVAAAIGSYVGAGIMSKLSEQKVQLTMGIALLFVAFLLILGQLNLMPSGGDAIGLTGIKLVIAVIGNFILGVLMTAGIGLYAPCMAMVSLLGMNPMAAFPIMMGSCAFVGPIASIKFVKEEAYEKEISMGITIGGIVGSILALLFVTNLPIYWLKWLVVLVVCYTSFAMLVAALKKDEDNIELQKVS